MSCAYAHQLLKHIGCILSFPDTYLLVQAQDDALQILREMERLKLAGQDYPSSSLLALRRVYHSLLLQETLYANVKRVVP